MDAFQQSEGSEHFSASQRIHNLNDHIYCKCCKCTPNTISFSMIFAYKKHKIIKINLNHKYIKKFGCSNKDFKWLRNGRIISAVLSPSNYFWIPNYLHCNLTHPSGHNFRSTKNNTAEASFTNYTGNSGYMYIRKWDFDVSRRSFPDFAVSNELPLSLLFLKGDCRLV